MEKTSIHEFRSIPAEFTVREDNGEMKISGYFAVYDSIYDIAPGMSESIAPGTFDNTISGDIRALINHDTTLVIGRTAAGTLELRSDSHGLWGDVTINPNDTDALNVYARVKRGDVSQCSIGFDIIRQDTEIREDGSVHWTIREVKLWEVSVCTFPAYEETNVTARSRERDELLQRKREEWQQKMLRKLKGE